MTVRESYRAERVEIYAGWLADDVDGLIHNIRPPFGARYPQAAVLLAEARERVTTALSHIDAAIAADRAANAEKETA